VATFAALRRFCASLPGAQAERKWGNVDTFLVHRKMFAIFTVDARGRTDDLWFKVDRERFLELTDRRGRGGPILRPAPYLARAGWLALADPAPLPPAEARALLARSHRLVAAGLPLRTQRALGLEPMRPPRADGPRLERPRAAAPGRPGLSATPKLIAPDR
jgi:predicted DNA-binding protein (MmcQ/YjbR family)